jgi:hypothetical protein
MRRREFISLIGSTAAAWPLMARAQQPVIPTIGFLDNAPTPPQYAAGFSQGLKETGYIEGQNVVIERRSAEGQYDRLPALAAEPSGGNRLNCPCCRVGSQNRDNNNSNRLYHRN